jgi:hypothetical protein
MSSSTDQADLTSRKGLLKFSDVRLDFGGRHLIDHKSRKECIACPMPDESEKSIQISALELNSRQILCGFRPKREKLHHLIFKTMPILQKPHIRGIQIVNSARFPLQQWMTMGRIDIKSFIVKRLFNQTRNGKRRRHQTGIQPASWMRCLPMKSMLGLHGQFQNGMRRSDIRIDLSRTCSRSVADIASAGEKADDSSERFSR